MKHLRNAARALVAQDRRFSEAAQIMDMSPAVVAPPSAQDIYVQEGHVARVVLITEGLGNRRNMNYYSSDAIMTAPSVFEGRPCFLNHPSESEERDIPERRVQDKCGYFKNCRVETIDGLTACTGELHFDLSEAGREAFDKSCTALHYREEFPGLDAEYVGLSIHADGDWDEREIELEGERMTVKYVTRFTDAVSCDLVTSPARGGRILALVESAAGAIATKEVDQMKEKLKKLMEAARSALRKADEEKDAAKKATLISEARKLNDQFLNEASKAAQDGPAEEAKKEEAKAEEPKETTEEAAEEPADKTESKKEKDMCADDDAEESKKEDDAPKAKKKMKKKDAKDDEPDEDDDAVEANRIAVAALLKESGVLVGAKRAARLEKLSLKEAKEEIEMLAEDQQSIVKGVLKQMRIPSGQPAKLTEAERDGDAESNNHLFADCYR